MTGWDPKAGNAAPRGCSGTPMAEKGGDSSSTLATLTEGNIGGKQIAAAEAPTSGPRAGAATIFSQGFLDGVVLEDLLCQLVGLPVLGAYPSV